MNFTVITNFSNKFACRKSCPYCSWNKSRLLPHGLQDKSKIVNFICECKKDFITISGGGDPLYNHSETKGDFFALVNLIKEHGYKVRVITREIDNIKYIIDHVDHISVSLDNEVFNDKSFIEFSRLTDKIEFSIVLPPYDTDNIIKLLPYYSELKSKVNGRLVLRENLDSTFKVDWNEVLKKNKAELLFVPKEICLKSRYLATDDVEGFDLMTNKEELYKEITSQDILLFGGFLRHRLSPEEFTNYSDIDMCIIGNHHLENLEDKFGYKFLSLSEPEQYPQYYIGRTDKMDSVELHVVQFKDYTDAEEFIFNSQLDIDRMYMSGGVIITNGTRFEEIAKKLIKKEATKTPMNERKLNLFHHNRVFIEKKYESKLIKKGWIIT